jgi:hypothetical protein
MIVRGLVNFVVHNIRCGHGVVDMNQSTSHVLPVRVVLMRALKLLFVCGILHVRSLAYKFLRVLECALRSTEYSEYSGVLRVQYSEYSTPSTVLRVGELTVPGKTHERYRVLVNGSARG